MIDLRRHVPAWLALALATLFAGGCGTSGPKPAAPGTPAFNWLSAKEAFKKGDYLKANDLLVTLAGKDHEYTTRAQLTGLVVSNALVRAYMEMSEKVAAGGKKSRMNPTAFLRLTGEYRSKAKTAGMKFAEMAQRFVGAIPADELTFQLGAPQGALVDPLQYQKIDIGQIVPEAELASMENHVVKHEVVLNTARALGLQKDPAKVKEAFANEEAKVPRSAYLLFLAEALWETADAFGTKKLNQPSRVIAALYDEALKVIALIPDQPKGKELAKKIKAAQKNLKV